MNKYRAEVLSFLKKCRNFILFFELTTHLFFSLSLLIIWFIIFALIDNILPFPAPLRFLNLAFFFIFILYFIAYTSYQKVKSTTLLNTALKIEEKYKFKDYLLTTLQPDISASQYFLENVFLQTKSLVQKVNKNLLINKKSFLKNLLIFSFCLLTFFLFNSLFKENFKITLKRFFVPSLHGRVLFEPGKIIVKPGNITILAGKNIEFKLITEKKPEKVLLFLYIKNEKIEIKPSLIHSVKTNFVYTYTFKNIESDLEYNFLLVYKRYEYEKYTEKYKIKVVSPPVITSLKVICYPPSYTFQKPVILENTGNIEIVEKSIARLKGTANNKLKKGFIKIGKKRIPLKINENSFEGKLYIRKNSQYTITLIDIYGHTNVNPPVYYIIAQKDEKPFIDFREPGRDIILKDKMKIPIHLYAQDDYAVNQIKFIFNIRRYYIKELSKTITNILNFQVQQTIEYKFLWDLNEYSLSPGDEIIYFASVWDGYKPAKSHTVFTRKYKIKFPRLVDLYKDIEKIQKLNISELESILKEQRKLKERIDNYYEQLKEKKNLSFLERKEIEKMRKYQERIIKRTEKLIKNLNKLSETIEKKNLYSFQIIKKLQEIRRLMNEVYTDEMKRNLERLNKLLKEFKFEKVKKNLVSSSLAQKELLKRLENTLKMLKNLQKQQKIESFKKRVDNLIKKQEKLIEKTFQKENPERINKSQRKILEDYQKLKEDMKNFAKSLDKKEEETFNKLIKECRADDYMKKAQKSLSKKDLNTALSYQQKARGELSKLSNSLSQMGMSMQSAQFGELFSLLNKMIFDFIQISFKLQKFTEFLFNNYSSYFKSDIEDTDVIKLTEDLIYIERYIRWSVRQFEEKAGSMVILKERFYKITEKIYSNFTRAREVLTENRNAKIMAGNKIKQSIFYLNLLIADLLKFQNELKNQMQAGKGENMADWLSQITESQKNLNQMLKDLIGKAKSQQLTPELQQYLEELAYQQELIRESLKSLLETFKDAGELLGNLGQALKEMGEIKKKIEKGELNKELIKKQEEVLKRLLDSEKSIYKKGIAKKRKAERAKEYTVTPPPELKLEPEKEEETFAPYLLPDIKRYMPEYRNLIDDYLKILPLIEESQ